jgi:hypothetical protein
MGITDKVVHTSNNGTPINLSVVIEKFLTPSNTNESIKIDPSMESKLTIDKYGTKKWILPNGKWHREDGPAIEYSDDDKFWYINGKRHREDGPAIEYLNGYKCWYINGKRHRENGPAVEWSNGDKSWYINGISYNEQEYKDKMRSIKLKQLL